MFPQRHVDMFLTVCFYLLTLALAEPAAECSPILGTNKDGIIYDIDPLTGLASNPRDTEIIGLSGIAFSPEGLLFGHSGTALYRIDPASGWATFVGVTSASGDFDFDPTTGVLFTMARLTGSPGSPLLTIDVHSGAWTVVGSLRGPSGSVGIDNVGDLYVLDGSRDELIRLSKVDGEVLSETSLDVDVGRAGLDFASDGSAFVLDGGLRGSDALYSLDPGSGNLTLIGNTGVPGGLTSIAIIPEPGTLVLFGVIAAHLTCRKRRREQPNDRS